jgi:tripeptide aminopeptidase
MRIDVVKEFMTLASLSSHSRREGPLAAYLLERFRELGLDAEVDDSAALTGSDTGNLIVRVPGSAPGPTVMLCAHMDTIGPTEGLVPVLRDGVVYGGGETVLGADDKGGIAIILAALAELLAGNLPHPAIEVVLTTQEEVGLVGAKHLRAELKADFGYILDGDGPVGHIVHQTPTKVDLDLVLEGKAAHAGICPEQGVNAIVTAATAISRLRTGRIDARTTSNVGLISGGTIRNMVADRAEVFMEIRSADPAGLEAEVQSVLDTFEQVAAEAGAALTVRKAVPFEAFSLDIHDPVVAIALSAARALGIEPRLWASGGGMDANVFNLQGLPCAGLGIGIEAAHSPQEHIAAAQLELGVKFVLALLNEAVSSSSRQRPA